MSAVNYVNSQAEVLKKAMALAMNINAAKGLQEVMTSNLGPKGTLKMLVGGAGQVKLTKDGQVLLKEMQIRHPTAAMIARASTAQDDIVGDGTTSSVLVIGDMLKQAERLIQEGIHPRIIADGYEMGRVESLKFLSTYMQKPKIDTELLQHVARTSLLTKLQPKHAEMLVDKLVKAVQTIKKEGQQIDLHMVEIMYMIHKMGTASQFVNGLVLDHGRRNSDMPGYLENCYILTCNVNLEDEKTEVNSGFFFSNAEEREELFESERKFCDKKVQKLIDLKKKVCDGTNKTFVVCNQKGIDPLSLTELAKHGILAVRRAKRRNMERLTLACGGHAVNSFEQLDESDLGFAEKVWEEALGDDKYTFIVGCKNPQACTLLLKGPADYTIAILKDAIRDGLRAIKNVYDDQGVLPGGGAFEIACHNHLVKMADNLKGKVKLGLKAFAESLLIIPKTLAQNSGFDRQDTVLKLVEAERESENPVGLDLDSGEPMNPMEANVYDNYCVKKQFLDLAPTLSQQLLLVDEIIKAGRQMKKPF